MFEKRLKRNSIGDESHQIKEIVEENIYARKLSYFDQYKEICSIKLVPINFDIKHGSWAVGLIVDCINNNDRHVKERLFVKKTSLQSFRNEKNSIESINNSPLAKFKSVGLPFDVIESDCLVLSKLLPGVNEKLNLRQCYLKFYDFNQKKYVLQRIAEYAKWLAEFHAVSKLAFLQSNVNKPELNQKKALQEYLYPVKFQLHKSIPNEVISAEIDDYLVSMTTELSMCFVHGDFGLQNIMSYKDQFKVVDWENFHSGCQLEDCISFMTNILTQSRHIPFDFGFTEDCLLSFQNEYFLEEAANIRLTNLTIMLAVQNVLKRHEWATKRFPLRYSAFYLPLLRRLFNKAYLIWKTT